MYRSSIFPRSSVFGSNSFRVRYPAMYVTVPISTSVSSETRSNHSSKHVNSFSANSSVQQVSCLCSFDASNCNRLNNFNRCRLKPFNLVDRDIIISTSSRTIYTKFALKNLSRASFLLVKVCRSGSFNLTAAFVDLVFYMFHIQLLQDSRE